MSDAPHSYEEFVRLESVKMKAEALRLRELAAKIERDVDDWIQAVRVPQPEWTVPSVQEESPKTDSLEDPQGDLERRA